MIAAKTKAQNKLTNNLRMQIQNGPGKLRLTASILLLRQKSLSTEQKAMSFSNALCATGTRRISRRSSMCRAACVLTLFAGAISFGANASAQEISGLEAAVTMERVLVDAIARAEQSVVAIARVRRGEEVPGNLRDPAPAPTDPRFVPNEYGTGVVVDAGGLILTNYHVLGDPRENDYYVWVGGKGYEVVRVDTPAEVLAGDPWTDLAVLKIEADDLQPITFGDASNLRKGQIVIALGNPYAIARDGQVSASWGIISNLSRQATNHPTSVDHSERGKTLHHYGTLIQTDAKLNLGTSGGALINLKGEMIGLTSSLAAMERYETPAGFAIPIDDAFKKTLETLKKGEKPQFGFLGVGTRNLTQQERNAGLSGVRVTGIVSGTPADRAGLQDGEDTGDIITHASGIPVADFAGLIKTLGELHVGTEVLLTIERGAVVRNNVVRRGIVIRNTAVLSKKHIDLPREAYSKVPDPQWRGMQVDYATAIPNLPEVSQLIDPQGCLAIVSVDPDTPAWKAGLRPGTFASHVGETRVSKPEDFYAAVQDKPGPVKIRLTYAPVNQDPVRTVQP